jgi:hypothetical protein
MKPAAFAVLGLGCALALAGCHDSSNVTAPVVDPGALFIGTWALASVNGVTVPAHTAVSSDSVLVYGRTLVIERQSNGIDDTEGLAAWNDSTAWKTCGPSLPSATCDASGTATDLLWNVSANSDTITVSRDPGFSLITGDVAASRVLVLQPDGTLVESNAGESDVYKKP